MSVLFAICVRLMRDRDVAQDVLQARRIFSMLHDVDGGGYPQLRLSRMAAAPPPFSSLDEAEVLAAVEARASGDPAIAADVRECLKKLATQMGAPVGSVKSWVHRAVRELGHCMGK